MNILTTFAQGYNDYYYSNSDSMYGSTSTTPADPAVVAVLVLLYILILAAAYVVSAIFLGKIFKKAGVKSWAAWVPVYNSWKLLEIGGQQGFWSVLAFIPVVNIVAAVFTYVSMYHVGKKLGKDGAFVVLGIFLPLVWLIWLAVDKSTWNDQASTAPSLAAR